MPAGGAGLVVMGTGGVVCLPFEDDVESPVTGQMA